MFETSGNWELKIRDWGLGIGPKSISAHINSGYNGFDITRNQEMAMPFLARQITCRKTARAVSSLVIPATPELISLRFSIPMQPETIYLILDSRDDRSTLGQNM